MGFFRLRTAPGTVWPPLASPQNSLLWSAYQTLDRTQWLSAKEIEASQFAQIRYLLRHAMQNVPYYKRVFVQSEAARASVIDISHFRQLPVLTREAYRDAGPEMSALALPEGMQPVGGPAFTSGTNGVPIRVMKTNRDELWQAAFCMRDFEWSGMAPHKTLAGIRLIAMTRDSLPAALAGVVSQSWTKFAPLVFQNAWAHGMDIRQDPVRQIEWLHKVKPSYLVSYPSNLEVLSSILLEKKAHIPGIEVVQTIGEPLTDEVKSLIEGAFRAPVKNLYSVTEGGYVASPCPDGPGLHVHSENFLAEVLDDDGNPCGPGETGRVVLTSLNSFLNPFIRYDIQDYATLAEEPCPCGRGLPLWTRVDGRRHPMLYLPEGRRRISTGLILGIRQIGGIRQFQVVQKASRDVVVRVVPDSSWTLEHETRIKALVREEAEAPAVVETLPVLGRSGGGKLKIVVVEDPNGRLG